MAWLRPSEGNAQGKRTSLLLGLGPEPAKNQRCESWHPTRHVAARKPPQHREVCST